MSKKLQLKIKYQWTDLKNKDGESYQFPQKRRIVNRKTLEIPGVYRWIKTARHNKKKKKVCLYVGESTNLYRRFYGYLSQNKTQGTSFRIGSALRTYVKKRAIIKYQILKLSASKFAGKKISQKDFRSMHVRQVIEQALIVYHKKLGECELNKEKFN
jgi:hypothetical protein